MNNIITHKRYSYTSLDLYVTYCLLLALPPGSEDLNFVARSSGQSAQGREPGNAGRDTHVLAVQYPPASYLANYREISGKIGALSCNGDRRSPHAHNTLKKQALPRRVQRLFLYNSDRLVITVLKWYGQD